MEWAPLEAWEGLGRNFAETLREMGVRSTRLAVVLSEPIGTRAVRRRPTASDSHYLAYWREDETLLQGLAEVLARRAYSYARLLFHVPSASTRASTCEQVRQAFYRFGEDEGSGGTSLSILRIRLDILRPSLSDTLVSAFLVIESSGAAYLHFQAGADEEETAAEEGEGGEEPAAAWQENLVTVRQLPYLLGGSVQADMLVYQPQEARELLRAALGTNGLIVASPRCWLTASYHVHCTDEDISPGETVLQWKYRLWCRTLEDEHFVLTALGSLDIVPMPPARPKSERARAKREIREGDRVIVFGLDLRWRPTWCSGGGGGGDLPKAHFLNGTVGVVLHDSTVTPVPLLRMEEGGRYRKVPLFALSYLPSYPSSTRPPHFSSSSTDNALGMILHLLQRCIESLYDRRGSWLLTPGRPTEVLIASRGSLLARAWLVLPQTGDALDGGRTSAEATLRVSLALGPSNINANFLQSSRTASLLHHEPESPEIGSGSDCPWIDLPLRHGGMSLEQFVAAAGTQEEGWAEGTEWLAGAYFASLPAPPADHWWRKCRVVLRAQPDLSVQNSTFTLGGLGFWPKRRPGEWEADLELAAQRIYQSSFRFRRGQGYGRKRRMPSPSQALDVFTGFLKHSKPDQILASPRLAAFTQALMMTSPRRSPREQSPESDASETDSGSGGSSPSPR